MLSFGLQFKQTKKKYLSLQKNVTRAIIISARAIIYGEISEATVTKIDKTNIYLNMIIKKKQNLTNSLFKINLEACNNHILLFFFVL